MYLTFVDVFACAIIGVEAVARFASTAIRAPIIVTPLRAQSGYFRTFVNIDAHFVFGIFFFEALLAVAMVRADVVHTHRVDRTDLEFSVYVV